jgi:hypothetical protein
MSAKTGLRLAVAPEIAFSLVLLLLQVTTSNVYDFDVPPIGHFEIAAMDNELKPALNHVDECALLQHATRDGKLTEREVLPQTLEDGSSFEQLAGGRESNEQLGLA